MTHYPAPIGGASLMLSFRPVSRTVLVIGSEPLAAIRAFASLEADAGRVVIAAPCALEDCCDEIRWRVKNEDVVFEQLLAEDEAGEAVAVEALLERYGDVSLVCVTDTLVSASDDGLSVLSSKRTYSSAKMLFDLCRRWRIPINVTDLPALCDFTFPSVHRFHSTPTYSKDPGPSSPSSPSPSPLQIAITTNGQGCRLGSRLKRELVGKLHPLVGDAVSNLGQLRNLARGAGSRQNGASSSVTGEDDGGSYTMPLNSPVPQYRSPKIGRTASSYFSDSIATVAEDEGRARRTSADREDDGEHLLRRMRWVNQISEYWPIDKLANMTEAEMRACIDDARAELERGQLTGNGDVRVSRCRSKSRTRNGVVNGIQTEVSAEVYSASRHNLSPRDSVSNSHRRRGRILLLGSGPGHPSLLTLAAHKALTSQATLVLSDKLVPPEVLALIPKNKGVQLEIAKKYPGNADGAQNELMIKAVEAADRGETVVRLKQGDPYLYGRGGEEVLYFRQHGYEPLVVPGISSALAGPLLGTIPVTQRGVSDSLTICTGVGRGGKVIDDFPGYVRSRTICILMGVARLRAMIDALLRHEDPKRRYPEHLPVAIVERASCPDQRVIASTLAGVEEYLLGPDIRGEYRTPGMLVIGWVVLALDGKEGHLDVLKDSASSVERDEEDRTRVTKWLNGRKGMTKDGLDPEWNQFLPV